MYEFVTRVYAIFTGLVILVGIGSMFCMIGSGNDDWIKYAGMAAFSWMIVTIVVAPICMTIARIPVDRQVPLPRRRQVYIINDRYDYGYYDDPNWR